MNSQEARRRAEELETFTRDIDLREFAKDCGYRTVQSSGAYWRGQRADKDEIVVTRKDGGVWVYANPRDVSAPKQLEARAPIVWGDGDSDAGGDPNPQTIESDRRRQDIHEFPAELEEFVAGSTDAHDRELVTTDTRDARPVAELIDESR